jgi:hypothetical protein
MNLYLVNGEEKLHPDNAPHRSHVAFAVSDAVARELVEKAYPHFQVAHVKMMKSFPGEEFPSHLCGSIEITPVKRS